jgi:hypothetical protein
MRDNDSLILESLYFSKVLITESLKGKVSYYKITDPYLINFIARYENLLPWNNIKTTDDIKKGIKILLDNLLDKVDYEKKDENPKTLYTTKVNWQRERNILQGMAENGDENARRVLQMYDQNPTEAQKKIMEDSNRNKRNIFQSYINYMLRDNEIYKNNIAFVYTVLSSVFSKTSNSTVAGLVPLNQAIVSSLYEKIKENPTEQFNVSDFYEQESVRLAEMEYETTESGDGKWIKIPSSYNDEENFEKNINQLMALASGTNWCIAGRSFAERYLDGGDFYIYFEEINGKSIGRAAIRMSGDEIAEIRGTEQNQSMNDKYVDNVLDLVRKEGLQGGEDFVNQLQLQKQLVPMMEKAKNGTITEEDLSPLINSLKSYGYKLQTTKDDKGNLKILFTNKTYDVEDFADEFKLDKLGIYGRYYDGSDFVDFDYTGIYKREIDELLQEINPDIKTKLENYAREKGWDENEMDLDEYIYDNDLMDLFSRAYSQGYQSGTENNIHKTINDYMGSIWFLRKFDFNNYLIEMYVQQFLELYVKYNDEFKNGENIEYVLKNEYQEDLSVPYNGFDEFDKKSAVERLEEELNEILR